MTSTSVTLTKEQIEAALRAWVEAGHVSRPAPAGSKLARIRFSGIPPAGISCGFEFEPR
jgi:hypothetical protein